MLRAHRKSALLPLGWGCNNSFSIVTMSSFTIGMVLPLSGRGGTRSIPFWDAINHPRAPVLQFSWYSSTKQPFPLTISHVPMSSHFFRWLPLYLLSLHRLPRTSLSWKLIFSCFWTSNFTGAHALVVLYVWCSKQEYATKNCSVFCSVLQYRVDFH